MPGPTPRVYVEANLDGVPQSKMRSVGIIEVTVSQTKGLARAIELAAEKGRELGCWVLIEHAIFQKLQSRASLAFGAGVTLAHGPAPTVGHTRAPSTLTAEFDCVVQGDGAGA